MEHLSSLDASFLHLETPETPMHVGSLMLLESPEGYAGDFYDELKDLVERQRRELEAKKQKRAEEERRREEERRMREAEERQRIDQVHRYWHALHQRG